MEVETLTITFEKDDDGDWKCTIEDWYNLSGYGTTQYDALIEASQNSIIWLSNKPA